jgi:uncharacterized protein
MQIGIITDSHDNRERIHAAVEIFNQRKVDRVIHAGDLVAPFTMDEFQHLTMPITCVFGNNDGERIGLKYKFKDIYPPPLEQEIDGHSVVVMHEPDCLEAVVSSGKYRVVIYGHTHAVDIRTDGPTIVINPGESCAWLTGKAHVAIWDTETMQVEHIEI